MPIRKAPEPIARVSREANTSPKDTPRTTCIARLPCRPVVTPIVTIAAAEAKNGRSLLNNAADMYQATLAARAICRITQCTDRKGAGSTPNPLRNEETIRLACEDNPDQPRNPPT